MRFRPLVGLAFLGLTGAAGAATWPGAAPCNTTLQDCINGVPAGEIVEIATNGPIAESPTIDKSLTLRPAAGFTPSFGPFSFFFLGGGAAPATIVVEGLTIDGRIRGSPGTADVNLRIAGNTVNQSGPFGVGIDISSGTFPPYGNVIATIEGNTVNVTGGGVGDQCGGINMGLIFDAGTSQGFILDNRVNVIGCGQGTGILSVPGPGETMTVDIIGNIVDATGTNDGIEVRNFFDAGQFALINARVINNVVFGQLDEAGFPGAIVISSDGGQQVQALVLNNTVANNESGIGVGGRADLGATITGLLANNISAFNLEDGISIEDDFEATFLNRNNLVFGNGFNFFTAGPGTLTADPLFVSASDLHLQAASPAINAGSSADVPPDITTDLDGAPRIALGVVDMGAYEAGVAAAGIPTLSTELLIGLAALLGAAGIWVLRRQA